MIQLGMAFLAFILVEGIYLQTIYNLEAGFIPGLVAAILAGKLTDVYLAHKNAKRDAPMPTIYRVPTPEAIAIVKRVLKTYYCGRSRWHLTYEDKQTGEIQASMNLIDDGYSDVRWLVPSGRIEKSINLKAWVFSHSKSTTLLDLTWDVDAPLSRTDCNSIIDSTTASIHEALNTAEAHREHGQKVSA